MADLLERLLPPLESDSDSDDPERVQIRQHGTINPAFADDHPETDEDTESQSSDTSSVALRQVSNMMISITNVEEPTEIEKPNNKTLANIVNNDAADGRSARSSSLGQLGVPRLAPNMRRHSDCALPSTHDLSPLATSDTGKPTKSSSAENIDKTVTHKRKLPKVPKQTGVLKARSQEDLTNSPPIRRPNQRVSNGGMQNHNVRRKTLAELAIENEAAKQSKIQENEIAPNIPVPNIKNAHRVDCTDGTKLQRSGSDDSIISTYSDAGSAGGPVVSGELCMALKYDEKKAVFHVHIHEAKDLAATDSKKNTSDPYIKVYLLPDRSKSGKRRTKVKRKTINPKYDEILDFKITHNDLLTRTVWVTVWNNDRLGKNDFLGEIYVSINEYLKDGQPLNKPMPQWYSLCEKGPAPKIAPIYAGEITLELIFKPGRIRRGSTQTADKVKGQLAVHLIGANNLKGADLDGFSDPFCKCFLLPDRSKKTQLKTPVIKHTCDPIWDHTISYPDVTLEELRTRTLEVTVWDYDLTSASDFLGCVRLGLGTGPEEWEDSREQEAAIWGTMLSRERTWVRAILPLRATIHSLKES